jgi:hypothetical protein
MSNTQHIEKSQREISTRNLNEKSQREISTRNLNEKYSKINFLLSQDQNELEQELPKFPILSPSRLRFINF